jgi:hypothetical protein
VQADAFNRSRIQTVIVVPLSTNEGLAMARLESNGHSPNSAAVLASATAAVGP